MYYVQKCKTAITLQEKGDVMTQLKALEREDRLHRQKSLAKLPVSIYVHVIQNVFS